MHARKTLSLLVAAWVASGAGTALAQGLEEVVVTAQKREQSLQDAPISIAAFGADALEQKSVNNIEDLGTSVPNVKITRSPSNTTAATIAIRGSTTINPAITWEPTVGLYMDGVFIGKNVGGIFDVAELERIEMLRGPQGTLYGKNTLGGAVNLITRKPSGEFSGKVRGGLGNHDLRTLFGTVDTGTLDLEGLGQVMAKVSGSIRKRDGFYDNVSDPIGIPLANEPIVDEANSLDNQAVRYDILWAATDRLKIRYAWDYSDIDVAPPKTQLTGLDPADLVGINALLAPYLTRSNDNRDEVSLDQQKFERSKSIAHNLFVDYDAGNWGAMGDVTLKYLGNTRKLRWDDDIDIDGTPLNFFTSARDIAYEQESHEFQLTGMTDRLNYVLGLYYFEEQADVYNPIQFFPLFGEPTSENRYGFENDSIAAFGQVEWRPAADIFQDRLTLTVGLRYTEEKKDTYIDHPQDAPPFAGRAKDTFDDVSPTFVAAWDLTDEINIYGKVAEGWKAGGFNGEAISLENFSEAYDAEEITSYELGIKSRWLDNRVQFNGAVFYNDSTDMQMSIFVAGNSAASVVQNAGEAVLQGFEFEIVALPTPDLELQATYGYLDAEYKEFIDNGVDRKDDKDFPYAPRHSASLSAEYTFLRASWGEMTGRLDWEFVDSHVPYIEPSQNAYSEIKPYTLLNGRLTVANIPVGEQQNLKLALWGKNLLDNEYRVNTLPFGFWTTSYFGDPRTYGVEATWEF